MAMPAMTQAHYAGALDWAVFTDMRAVTGMQAAALGLPAAMFTGMSEACFSACCVSVSQDLS